MSNKSQIKYTISMDAPHTHTFDVKIEVDGHTENYINFKMPVWTPGSYLVREFSKNIISASASSKQVELPIEKISKNMTKMMSRPMPEREDGTKLQL